MKPIQSLSDPRINPFGWRILVPCIVPALISLFAPIDVLSQNELLQPYVKFFVSLVPPMVKVANTTIYPEVWLLAHCVMLTIILPTAVWWMRRMHMAYKIQHYATQNVLSKKQHIKMALGLPFFLLLLYAVIAIPGDGVFLPRGFSTHNRGGLAFITFICSWCTVLAIGGQYPNARLFFKFYLRGSKK